MIANVSRLTKATAALLRNPAQSAGQACPRAPDPQRQNATEPSRLMRPVSVHGGTDLSCVWQVFSAHFGSLIWPIISD
jgi:hypothetical protein